MRGMAEASKIPREPSLLRIFFGWYLRLHQAERLLISFAIAFTSALAGGLVVKILAWCLVWCMS